MTRKSMKPPNLTFDGAGDLRVQRAPVGDDDDRIELRRQRVGGAAQFHQLVLNRPGFPGGAHS